MNKLKIALIGVALVLGVVNANASTDVNDVQFSSCTFNQVTVSTFGFTTGIQQVFSKTLIGTTTNYYTDMLDRKYLKIQNTDASNDVACGSSAVAFSTTSLSDDTTPAYLKIPVGDVISHANGYLESRLQGKDGSGNYLIPFCVNLAASGTVKINVKQCK